MRSVKSLRSNPAWESALISLCRISIDLLTIVLYIWPTYGNTIFLTAGVVPF